MSYLENHLPGTTPQSAPLIGSSQVPNSAGGYAWPISDWERLRRFLVLGTEGGSYYAGETRLTRENAAAVERCLAEDGARAVKSVAEVSAAGRAPRNDAAIFALAMAAGLGDEPTRRAALDALPAVCRTSTHLFMFARFVEGFRGWGRSLRRAVGQWYAARTPEQLAYQAVKYRQRDGVSHRDMLRLAHPGRDVSAGNPELEITDVHEHLFEWIVRGELAADLPPIVAAAERASTAATPADSAVLIREAGLPREAVRSEHLTSPEVWEALLEDMPMTALVRNLANMTRAGVLAPGSDGTRRVAEQLGDAERLRAARVHPMSILVALRTYAGGQGVRGGGTWEPVGQVVDALDAAFYTAFENAEPSGRRFLLALDVSGSMTWGQVAGAPGLSPRDASAAMALVTAAREPAYEVVGFYAGEGGFVADAVSRWRGWHRGLSPLAITPGQRLDDAVKAVSDLPFGGTDCALPMLYALDREREVDVFVIYTDSETWAGDVHPAEALREYRQQSGIPAKLVVVGMVSNGFSIADPDDAGMLDVVGFDTAAPDVISGFAAGAL